MNFITTYSLTSVLLLDHPFYQLFSLQVFHCLHHHHLDLTDLYYHPHLQNHHRSLRTPNQLHPNNTQLQVELYHPLMYFLNRSLTPFVQPQNHVHSRCLLTSRIIWITFFLNLNHFHLQSHPIFFLSFQYPLSQKN